MPREDEHDPEVMSAQAQRAQDAQRYIGQNPFLDVSIQEPNLLHTDMCLSVQPHPVQSRMLHVCVSICVCMLTCVCVCVNFINTDVVVVVVLKSRYLIQARQLSTRKVML